MPSTSVVEGPGSPPGGGRGQPLSPRQRYVLELLARGVRVQAIAAHLGISETTVRNHVRAILKRLDCHSQLEAVAKARRLGLVR